MALNIDELREKAGRKLRTAVFDFMDCADDDEVKLRRNREAFGRYALVARVGIDGQGSLNCVWCPRIPTCPARSKK